MPLNMRRMNGVMGFTNWCFVITLDRSRFPTVHGLVLKRQLVYCQHETNNVLPLCSNDFHLLGIVSMQASQMRKSPRQRKR